MAKLDQFVAPHHWPAFSRAMGWVNRIVMLHGLPILRDIPLLRRVPGIRGLTDIRHILVDQVEIAKLKTLCASDVATFIVPNHPEYFTDWMIDKDIILRCCPNAASWATNGVVNGMGNSVQKFWLWNNLIAQIPGNSDAAKEYSIEWALKGNTVVLHPEGYVGWHSNYVAPLMSGAAEMALEAKRRQPNKKAFLVPVVWKLEYTEDATEKLLAECNYIEKKLQIQSDGSDNPAQRVYAIYNTLLDRDGELLGLKFAENMGALEKRHTIERTAFGVLAQYVGSVPPQSDITQITKLARRKIRNEVISGDEQIENIRKLIDRLQNTARLGDFAGVTKTITQEEVGEHLKRLRQDWCKGTLRDTINAYMPQPAGRRRAHLRILDAVEVQGMDEPNEVMASVRTALQAALDDINQSINANEKRIVWENPFLK